MQDDLLFSWLHLSDIHLTPRDNKKRAHQELVMAQLLQDLREQRRRAITPAPEMVFLTGDIAYHGGSGEHSGEYARALEWIDEMVGLLGLERADVFVIPGNHDVRRTVGDTDEDRWLRDLREPRAAHGTPQAIDDAIELQRSRLEGRFEEYLKFAAELAPERGGLFWTARRQSKIAADRALRIIGLNTALLCNDDYDQGKLELGYRQIGQLKADEGDIALVLSHHPLQGGWLRDEAEVVAWVRRQAHLHLSGHIHDPEVEGREHGGGATLVQVSAGAVSGDRVPMGGDESHGYSFGGIALGDDGGVEVRIWPRRLSEQRKVYRVDTHLLGDYEHHSRHRIASGHHDPNRSGRQATRRNGSGDGGGVCSHSSEQRRALRALELRRRNPREDNSNLYILLLQVGNPGDCHGCFEYLKSHPRVEAINDVFGPFDIVARARSVVAPEEADGKVPADIARIAHELEKVAKVEVLDVTFEYRAAAVRASAQTRGVKAFLLLREATIHSSDFLVRTVIEATTSGLASTASTFLLGVYEVAARAPDEPHTVVAECLITCGGYYDLVELIVRIENALSTTERRTLLAMTDWSREQPLLPVHP